MEHNDAVKDLGFPATPQRSRAPSFPLFIAERVGDHDVWVRLAESRKLRPLTILRDILSSPYSQISGNGDPVFQPSQAFAADSVRPLCSFGTLGIRALPPGSCIYKRYGSFLAGSFSLRVERF
jgi:hypothetical protein